MTTRILRDWGVVGGPFPMSCARSIVNTPLGGMGAGEGASERSGEATGSGQGYQEPKGPERHADAGGQQRAMVGPGLRQRQEEHRHGQNTENGGQGCQAQLDPQREQDLLEADRQAERNQQPDRLAQDAARLAILLAEDKG